MRFADIVQLLCSSKFWLLLIASGAIQSAHAVYYVFGSIHWKAIDISPTVIGFLWAVGVVAEIVLFIYAGRLGLRFGAVQFILIGGAAAMLRWLFTAFDPPLAALFALQCLHGLTFGATHFGAMQFLRQAVPQKVSLTAQGIYAAVTGGIMMGLMQLAAGPLYSKLHGHAYLVMVALGAIGVVAALFLMRRWKDGAPLFGQKAE
jgi:PPP family 3-phenylpropionic acid transporter